MPTFEQARKLASAWIDVMVDGLAELVPGPTITKPYGWVFFYQSSEFLRDTSDFRNALAGNAPILIDRVDGEIRVLGTAQSVEWYLSAYEKTIPAARLQMGIEQPTW
jgi:hypothetical protein